MRKRARAGWTVALAMLLTTAGCDDDDDEAATVAGGGGAEGAAARAEEQATGAAGDEGANPNAEPHVDITVSGPGLDGEHVFRFDPSGQGRLNIFSDQSGLYMARFTPKIDAAQGSAKLEKLTMSLVEVQGGSGQTRAFEMSIDPGLDKIRLDEDDSELEWDIEAFHGSATERVRGEAEGSRCAGSFEGTVPERDSGETYQLEGTFDIVD